MRDGRSDTRRGRRRAGPPPGESGGIASSQGTERTGAGVASSITTRSGTTRGGVPATLASIGSSSVRSTPRGVRVPVRVPLSCGSSSSELSTTMARSGLTASTRRPYDAVQAGGRLLERSQTAAQPHPAVGARDLPSKISWTVTSSGCGTKNGGTIGTAASRSSATARTWCEHRARPAEPGSVEDAPGLPCHPAADGEHAPHGPHDACPIERPPPENGSALFLGHGAAAAPLSRGTRRDGPQDHGQEPLARRSVDRDDLDGLEDRPQLADRPRLPRQATLDGDRLTTGRYHLPIRICQA